LAKGAQPLLKYEIIGRNFNDAEKSEQCSKVTHKLIESNKLGGDLGRSPQPPETNGGLGAFQLFTKK